MAEVAPAGLPEPPPAGHQAAHLVEFGAEERSQWRMVVTRFIRHRLAMASLVLFILLILLSFFGQHVARYRYDEIGKSVADYSQAPSLKHWFGTDGIGHDTFAQVVRGARRSVIVALVVALLSTTFGAFVGSLAGYFRGWLDTILMRFTDLFLTIPTLAVLLVVSARYRTREGNWVAIALIIAGLAWMPLARVVRGVFLSLREREFTEAALALGASSRRIILRHLLPNAMGPIIVNATLVVAQAILVETALSFLGFGISPPDTSLGRLVAEGVTAATTRPWLFYMPGFFLMMIALSVNFIGDGLRDAFDPRQTKVRA